MSNTSEIGAFKVLSESGIASGVRRIEAVAADAAVEYLNSVDGLVRTTATALKVSCVEGRGGDGRGAKGWRHGLLAADAAVEYLNSGDGLVRTTATALKVSCECRGGEGWRHGMMFRFIINASDGIPEQREVRTTATALKVG